MKLNKCKPVPQCNALNAVIYARYSSEKQTENSIDGQLHSCNEYAARHGYSIVGEYIDRAKSGTNDNRSEFQQMIADAKKQQFAFVIVYRFDRFARNRYDSAIYKKHLESYGVRVLSAEESIGTGDEGIILESIYEALAESYSRRLSKIVTRGMRETALKGLSTGGNISYGLKIEDHKIVIDEAKAPIVRFCFEARCNGLRKKQIADELNAQGHRTKTGKLFTSNTIAQMLANDVYMGNNNFADIERTCPAIITAELFEKVQRIEQQEKKQFGQKPSSVFFALSGKAYCGYCGTAIIGDSGTSRSGDKHFYYTCAAKKKKRACTKKSEKQRDIEWFICEQTINTVLAESSIKAIAKNVTAIAEKETDVAQIIMMEKQLAAIEKEFDAAADALIRTNSPIMTKRINDKVELLEAQKETIETALARLRIQQGTCLTADQIEDFLRSFRHGNLLDENFRRYFIKTFINSIYLFDDKIIIYYNIGNTSTEITFTDMLEDTAKSDRKASNVRPALSMAHQEKATPLVGAAFSWWAIKHGKTASCRA